MVCYVSFSILTTVYISVNVSVACVVSTILFSSSLVEAIFILLSSSTTQSLPSMSPSERCQPFKHCHQTFVVKWSIQWASLRSMTSGILLAGHWIFLSFFTYPKSLRFYWFHVVRLKETGFHTRRAVNHIWCLLLKFHRIPIFLQPLIHDVSRWRRYGRRTQHPARQSW